MSESPHSTPTEPLIPRAVIHKRILEAAEESPDASYGRLADQIGGASANLVEQVLEEYGDPADAETSTNGTDVQSLTDDQSDAIDDASHSSEAEATVPDQPETALSDKQLETFRTIARHPGATQAEIADQLDVSPATVCNRVNAVDGFDWADRAGFVDTLFGNGVEVPPSTGADTDGPSELAKKVMGNETKIEQLEHRLDTLSVSYEALWSDPDLGQRVIQACIDAEEITENEVVRITEAVIGELETLH